MRPTSTHAAATHPVLPSHFTLSQSLPDGPPDQHLYEPPLLFRVHPVVVQGTLALGSVIVCTVADDVLALARMLK